MCFFSPGSCRFSVSLLLFTRLSPLSSRLLCPPSPFFWAAPSLFFCSVYPFNLIHSLLLHVTAFLLCRQPCCVFEVCVGETERESVKDGGARPLWWRRGIGVSRALLTEAKWCHAVPLSDHLSAKLASTQAIKVSCPSCQIKSHITKDQFGCMFNCIYCSCIIGSLFLPLLAAERIKWKPTKKNNNNSLCFWKQSTLNLQLYAKFILLN